MHRLTAAGRLLPVSAQPTRDASFRPLSAGGKRPLCGTPLSVHLAPAEWTPDVICTSKVRRTEVRSRPAANGNGIH
jgi:hypothetical protein